MRSQAARSASGGGGQVSGAAVLGALLGAAHPVHGAWGSGRLLQTLLQHGLVDRFRLMTYPLVLGSGRRLFDHGSLPTTMRAVDLTTTELGIVIGTYEPAGPVRHGEM